MLRVHRLAGVVLVALLAFYAGGAMRTSAATTATATLVASDDGYVDSSRPTRTGTGDELEVDAKPTLRSYVKFDLSSIRGTVTSAVLKLTATSSSKLGFDVREVASSSWSERSLTYSTAPAYSASIGAS